MQLTIDSEDTVGIKMSALEESQNNEVSALIDDIKKEIQSNVNDDLKLKDEEASAVSISTEGEVDITDVKPEIQSNGRSEDEIIPNGAPNTPNNDKENDAPKDSETVVKVENNENTANSNNCTVEINKNQAITDSMDLVNDNASSTQDKTATEDVINTVLDNKPAINDSKTESPSLQPLDNEKIASEISNSKIAKSTNENPPENNEEGNAELVSDSERPEIPNSNNAKIFNEDPLENNEQIDTELLSDSTNSMEISAADNIENNALTSSENNESTIITSPEEIKSVDSKEITKERQDEASKMEIDVNEVVENSSRDEADKSATVENNGQLESPAETNGLQIETTTRIPKDLNETNISIVEQNILVKPIDQENSESSDLKIIKTQKETPTDHAKKGDGNTNKSEECADPVVTTILCKTNEEKISSLDKNDKQTLCKPEIESVTEDITEPTAENKTESKNNEIIASDKVINNVTPSEIETKTDVKTENEMIVDISKNEPKSEIYLSDGKSNEKSIKTEDQLDKSDPNENKVVVENPVVETLKDTDIVSLSSMEVDDVEIVPTEKAKSEGNKNKDDAIDVSLSNNDDNVIEILDQDVIESFDKVEPEKKTEINLTSKKIDQPSNKEERLKLEDKVDISDEDDIKIVEDKKTKPQIPKKEEPSVESKPLPVVCKLSNTLDILSDEEDEPPSKVSKTEEKKPKPEDKQCINIDDDDDIMLIEDTKESTTEAAKAEKEEPQKTSDKVNDETGEKEASKSVKDPTPNINEKEPTTTDIESPKLSEKEASPPKDSVKESSKPLLPINFLKSAKKNLAEMTRDELEEFCILKIVEGIVDRSSLSDIKSKMKTIEKNMEDYKKKAMLLAKQNRDLQVVLKSVQEEQKNRPNTAITPLKITRSVGMQVLMIDKGPKKKPAPQNTTANTPKPITRNMAQPTRPQRTPSNSQNIPVPRLIPASPAKAPPSSPVTTVAKPVTPNGIRNTVSPAQKAGEKRPMTRQAAASSNMTVDLTDDEPPAKVNKSSPVPPVRLVPSQNLMAPVRGQQTNNPRKVFIPINGQGPNLVRGQTAVMLKSVPQNMGPRQRLPLIPRMAANQVRMNMNRHPAPLPDVMKQYQPPTWKALPPAPDLKLSKVENGIVISWKIEGYQEDSYEKIASYQLYAYQETSTPPSTALWKKIGDVKALPLPMACTLTQFMAGFKYYFAVRAVDVKSRLGPFSLPGSILLLNKM